MTIASMLRSDLMALRLSFSANSRRSSSVRTSRTWSGTADGLARRATASLAAAAGGASSASLRGEALAALHRSGQVGLAVWTRSYQHYTDDPVARKRSPE